MITILLSMLAVPAIAAVYCWKGKGSDVSRLNILWISALAHFILTCFAIFFWKGQPFAIIGFWGPNAGLCFLTSLLFLLVALHTRFWLPAEQLARESQEHPEGLQRVPVFTACLLGFLATMTLAIISCHLGLLWVAVEATTLVSAPLIMFHRSKRSIEAMWKYLLICSVGIALALLGTMFLAVAAPDGALDLKSLSEAGDAIKPGWFKAAFILALVGYGTKMGLAPFHTWLPDAHSEAPGTVSALLSAALLNCSFLAIFLFRIVAPGAVMPFVTNAFTILGLLSLTVAALFIIGQDDFKRMLAYSSVEHMGLIALFAGIDCFNYEAAVGWAHIFGHSLIKMALFLIAGNLLLACGTRQISRLGGLFKFIPRNAFLFVAGTLMICGLPPSPLFFTELCLLVKLPVVLACVTAGLLFLIFAGMTRNALKLVMGPAGEIIPEKATVKAAERLIVIPIIALVVSLILAVLLN